MSETPGDLKPLVGHVATGAPLSEEQAVQAFDIIMSGSATPAQIGGFLMALRVRGETVEEIAAAAKVMREKAVPISAPANAIDVVGTGGDAKGTYNISTGAAIVVAACGVPVAKHGNKALSSKSGAADVLTALGVNIETPMPQLEKAIREAGIGFMMAPRHHMAMRHVMGPRTELATRTVFNLLGPLSNPAGVKRLMTGVFAAQWVEPVAHVLGRLGSEKAWIVHGSDGMDELTTTGPTLVAELKNGKVTTFEIIPEDAGLPRVSIDDLIGGTPEFNAAAIRAMLAGKTGPYRDVVLLNAAAALIVADTASDLKEGVAKAAAAIDSGKALSVLDALNRITNEA
ncbi:MAG: anthranilate phosphoribosyltransferase [Magnetospiraceae bacterium]